MFDYKILKKSQISKARTGLFNTPHGAITTPVFMPVGTVGAVKTMMPSELKGLGSQIILGNTYHLYLRPGDKLIKKLGGLAKFSCWNMPTLTDSGGYQAFSLGEGKRNFQFSNSNFQSNRNEKISKTDTKFTEKGVEFRSHLDGSKHFISPEKSIEIQENLGADIIMAFDHVAPADATKSEVEEAMERTHRWLARCIKAKSKKNQALFPICQGGQFKDLREKSAAFIEELDLPGNAIGGVSVGEKKEKIYEVTNLCTDILPENKPRYLMGIGYPEDICNVIKLGIDMFDCVLPTRLARHGNVWVKSKSQNAIKLLGLDYNYEQIDLTKRKNLNSGPIDKSCRCPACQACPNDKNRSVGRGFSRFYLNHLIKEREPLGIHLLTVHNLYFTNQLVRDIREKIREKKF
ncbi:MAG: tRNA guanosine(34) transglycosylase Tgt [bacterium]